MPASTKAPRNETDVAFDAEVGQRIRDHRKAAGMTQSDLARAAGVTFQQVQKYERGTNRVAASRLSSIAAAVGVPPSELLGEEPADGPRPTPDQRRLLALYDQASPEQRKIALSFLESVAAKAA
ncbi:MAG: helix-turn-helix domain-containing protein [Brevundimonas sp.]|nr:MAG: helix-turn-helix domain-containing protein [Brevundimonas sp.]